MAEAYLIPITIRHGRAYYISIRQMVSILFQYPWDSFSRSIRSKNIFIIILGMLCSILIFDIICADICTDSAKVKVVKIYDALTYDLHRDILLRTIEKNSTKFA